MRISPPTHLPTGDATARRRCSDGASARPRGSRLVPILALALCGSTAWAGATSYYIVFRDEMLGRFFAQVRAVQLAYEERVGALQSQVARSVSDRIKNRENVEGRLGALAERQALIERRQEIISGLGPADPATTGSIAPSPPPSPPLAAQPQKPFLTPAPFDAESGFDLRRGDGDGVALPERRLDQHLGALEGRLDRLAQHQSEALAEMAAKAAGKARRLRGVIQRAGLDPNRFEKAERGIGGPLVPVSGDAFDLALAEAERSAGDEQRLRRTVAALPLRRPLDEDAVATSTFGTRLDPFTRGLALHTGLDLRADHGAPARATAAGRVTAAEYGGGYGNMVEIDHGHGLVTRYAHLASYSVVPGQRVEAGAIVGRVGSTGRSTGNHLHYETRIDGEPVDPQRFLKAGASLTDAASAADGHEHGPDRDSLSAESWVAWSHAQLQMLDARK